VWVWMVVVFVLRGGGGISCARTTCPLSVAASCVCRPPSRALGEGVALLNERVAARPPASCSACPAGLPAAPFGTRFPCSGRGQGQGLRRGGGRTSRAWPCTPVRALTGVPSAGVCPRQSVRGGGMPVPSWIVFFGRAQPLPGATMMLATGWSMFLFSVCPSAWAVSSFLSLHFLCWGWGRARRACASLLHPGRRVTQWKQTGSDYDRRMAQVRSSPCFVPAPPAPTVS
jgi:hypothetical protein